mmetsp:Transcript_3500/g.9743  ORF Transcript_3500/g.9743 Transcript_3500/m.9743 type:complete len:228 (+) Transcript_3500:41-724(+)
MQGYGYAVQVPVAGAQYGQVPHMMMAQQQMPPMTSDVFVEVMPQVAPNFNRGPNGTFVMDLPPIAVRLQTSCTPGLPQVPGLVPFKPCEEFYVLLPELQRVIFDPNTGNPPGGMVQTQVQKSGAVLEAPPNVTLNAQCKANSPFGSLILEDIQTCNGHSQKIGETSLDYRLQVDAHMNMNHGAGNMGSNRLEVLFCFTFQAQVRLGGTGPAQATMAAGMGGYGGAYG